MKEHKSKLSENHTSSLRTKLRAIMVLSALIAVQALCHAQFTEKFTFSEYNIVDGADVPTIEGNTCTLTFSDGGNDIDAPQYYNSDKSIHFYSKNRMTISSNRRIIQVDFEFDDKDHAPTKDNMYLSEGTYNYTKHIWTGDTKSLIWGKNTLNETYRLVSLTVTTLGDPTTISFYLDDKDVSGQSFTVLGGQPSETEFVSPIAKLAPEEAGTLTYASSNTSVAQVDATSGVVSFANSTAFGSTTITATFEGNDDYVQSSAQYTIVRNKYLGEPTTVSFGKDIDGDTLFISSDAFSGHVATLTPQEAMDDGGAITYSSSDEAVATVDASTGMVSLKAYGMAKITARFAGKEGKWRASSASYTISYQAACLTFDCNDSAFCNLPTSYVNKAEIPFIGDDGNSYPFTVTQCYRQENWWTYKNIIAMNTNCVGTIVSPVFTYEKGFTVKVLYNMTQTNASQQLSLTSGTQEGTIVSRKPLFADLYLYEVELNIESQSASFTITAGDKATTVVSIVVIPNGGEVVSCGSISEALATDSGTVVSLALTDAVVAFAADDDVYLSDSTGWACLRGASIDGLVAGNAINGTVILTRDCSHGQDLLMANDLTTAMALTIGEASAATSPTALASLSDLQSHANSLVTISGTASIGDDGAYITDGTASVRIHDRYATASAMPYDGASIEVTGIAVGYDGEPQIWLTSNASVIITLDEEMADNAIGQAEGVNVRISRYLSSEYWNTLCLPFSVPAEMVDEMFGAGTVITEFTGEVNGRTMIFADANNGIEAGKPYLFRPERTMDAPTFYGVNTTAEEPQSIGSAAGFRYVGIYSAYDMRTDGSQMFVSTDGQLFAPGTEPGYNTIYGMRAYIEQPSSTEASLAGITIDHTLGISVAPSRVQPRANAIYSLSGQRMGSDQSALPKGIYIFNGKKIIIK